MSKPDLLFCCILRRILSFSFIQRILLNAYYVLDSVQSVGVTDVNESEGVSAWVSLITWDRAEEELGNKIK